MAADSFHKLSFAFRAFLVFGYLSLAVPFAQSQNAPSTVPAAAIYPATMTFDVASVRETHPDLVKGFLVGGRFSGRTSSLTLSNVKIADLLQMAYGLSRHNLSGLPAWASLATYDVQAKSDESTDKKLASLSQEQVSLEQQHMLQTLLVERFHIETHWSTKERSVYNLVVARGGLKILKGGSMPPPADLKLPDGVKTPELYQRGGGTHGYEFVGRECHITSLAKVLGMLMSTDVLDKTGLSSTYDFNLRYSQASDAQREKDPDIFPPVPEAVEDQLGLKLERAKGSTRELVVDRIDKPSAN